MAREALKTNKEMHQEMQDILEKHNIRMEVGGCGCCGSPWIKFEYEGKLILYEDNSSAVDESEFNMFY